MKKITYVLALLGVLFSSVQSTFAATDSNWADKWIASVGDAVTSLEGLTNGYYVLRNVGRKTFLCENDDNKLYLWNATNGSDDIANVRTAFVHKNTVMSSVVYVTKNTGTNFYTMQFKSGQYLGASLPHGGAASSNATAGNIVISFVSGNQFNFRPDESEWANGNGNGGYSEGSFTGWGTTAPGADGNGAYQFYPVTLEESKEITLNWTVTDGTNTLTTFTSVDKLGNTVAIPSSFEYSYFYNNPTITTENKTIAKDNCNFTIQVTKGAEPYVASTADAPIWYTIKFRNDDKKHLVHVLATDNGIGTQRAMTAEFCGQYNRYETYKGGLWAFVNDGLGVKVLNKQTGKYINCAATGNATLTAAGTTFIVKTNSTGGFSLQVPGNANAHLGDHSNGSLAAWVYYKNQNENSQNDGGSNFGITKVDDSEALLTVGKAAMKIAENSTNLTAFNATNLTAKATVIDAATNVAGLDAAYETIKTSSFIPETGVYYRIKNMNLNDNQKAYISSENIFVGTDGVLTTSYNANNNIDRVVRRTTASGNFVSQLWQAIDNGDGTCKLHNANTNCNISSYVASGLDMPINTASGGSYTVKAVPSATFVNNDGKTMLQINTVNGNTTYRINAFQGDANTVISDYDGNHDNNKGNYWQFIKVTSVPVAISAANYASASFPFATQLNSEEGVKAFYATHANAGKIALVEIEDGIIPANTGVLLYHEGATTANLTITTTEKTITGNILTGANAKRTGFTEDATYVMALNSNNEAAFLKNGLTVVPANKAYISEENIPTEAGASVLNFDFGTVTDINAATVNNDEKATEYYDLQGRRVLYPSNGIFVTNKGQKVFMK